jgi:hypothetical protein
MSPEDEEIVASRASDDTRRRVFELLEMDQRGMLSAKEQSEVEHYLQLEHLNRVANARARLRLAD